MRILIVTQYFWPENFRVNDLAAALKARGHRVTVLTGKPNYPGGAFFPGYGFFARGSDDFDGIPVIRVPLVPRGRGGGLRLAINYLSFALFASVAAPFRCRDEYDVIFVYEVSPITVALPALVLRLIRRTPVLLWVLDLWPESLSATGRDPQPDGSRGRFPPGTADLPLERPGAGPIPRFRSQGRRHGSAGAQDRVLPELGGVPVRRPAPAAPPPVPLPRGFRVVYAGNVGAAQDFPAVLAAAELTRSRVDVHWIIVGEGRMHGWVEREIEKRGLAGTVHLAGGLSARVMPALFREADVMLVSLRKIPYSRSRSPASFSPTSRPAGRSSACWTAKARA
jgi:glycosyltransferase involved in cell wall biosynthesis